MASLGDLRRVWIGPELPGFRPRGGTYTLCDCATLPAVSVSAELAWLVPLEPDLEKRLRVYRRPEARRRVAKNWGPIRAQAQAEGITLPESFQRLMQSQELQDQIPSVTACYFDLPDHIMRSPFEPGDHLLRFLNDQQACYCWYLYMSKDGETAVVCSSGVETEESPVLDEVDFESSASLADLARQSTWWVSPSFDEFLYRFWLENLLWYRLHDKAPLSVEQLAYVRHYQPGYAG